jgi:pilus assembly protein CpaE
MPGLSGYEVTQRLRRDPRFAHIPILILTAQTELEDKLKAFEAGADDHMIKPFEPAELLARVSVLLRRSESMKALQQSTQVQLPTVQSRLIAIHSLRGGIGCTSLAINLGLALQGLWACPTLLIDLVLTAGQVALMLNSSLKRTWADISNVKPTEVDLDVLQSITSKHESGLSFIAAPTLPSEAGLLTDDLLTMALKLLRTQYEYIVVDLPHDFGGTTLQVLDAAEVSVMLLAPEMASIRAAAAALDTYRKLNYGDEKIKLILNWTFERKGLPRKNIEAALRHSIDLVLPFAPDLFVEAINLGRPLLYSKPNEKVSQMIEWFASQISKPEHRSNVPAAPARARR